MSRLTDKIKRAQESIYEAESRLDDLHDKQRKYNRKRARKALRKKLAKDAVFFANYKFLQRFESNLYQPPKYSSCELVGLSAQLRRSE